ncbi:TetR/AcrR family transcriptional regulator [Streptomyces sp. NBC_01239]|uniref:TetR/AcrR family transcriptional regulator n=1 Tax=Streptomyces sp. NBC_01239 TaxID=2903792 RepID=UPI0022526E33|nr:TetR family transcriptional regulator [Streptomyces sp. NBC_01239]MCX4816328.1 TetR/AcrR family transcriptional regulator [Streptomyces sp. NBC_01239]
MSQTSPERPARRTGSRSGGQRNARGEETRLRILTAAERLFAEHGISAVPLRDIGVAAGQRNHAAVQYHFGDRDEVVKAIMEFRGAESEARRADFVADLAVGGSASTVVDVVSAFVRPLAIHLQPDNHYLAFLSLYITEEGGYEGLIGVRTGASVITLRALLGRLVPTIPKDVLDERWLTVETGAVHALARYHSAQRKRGRLPAGLDVLVEDLIVFLSAGLVAPLAPGDPRT